MLRGLSGEFVFYAAITVFAILFLFTNISPLSYLRGLPKVSPSSKRFISVSIQGGMYLLLQVEEEKAVKRYLEQVKATLADALKEQGVVGKIEREKDMILSNFPGAKEKVDNLLTQRFQCCVKNPPSRKVEFEVSIRPGQ